MGPTRNRFAAGVSSAGSSGAGIQRLPDVLYFRHSQRLNDNPWAWLRSGAFPRASTGLSWYWVKNYRRLLDGGCVQPENESNGDREVGSLMATAWLADK